MGPADLVQVYKTRRTLALLVLLLAQTMLRPRTKTNYVKF